MSEHNSLAHTFSRRALLKSLQYAPIALLPAPLKSLWAFGAWSRATGIPFADSRITPHYPSGSPMDQMMALVPPVASAVKTVVPLTSFITQPLPLDPQLSVTPQKKRSEPPVPMFALKNPVIGLHAAVVEFTIREGELSD